MEPLVAVQIAVAALQNLLFAMAAGSLACALMGKRSGIAASAALRSGQAGLAIVLTLTALAYLWLQAAVMSGSPLAGAGPAVTAVLTQSHYGVAWSVGFIGAVLAVLSRLSDRRGLPLFAAGLIAWVAGKAAASHAADAGDFSARELIHVVHLCATALWAGSVIVAGLLARRLWRVASATAVQRAAFCAALSHLATAALVIVLVTGFYNVVQDTAHADAPLVHTPWGHILAAKLACVALAIALGGWNRMAVLPVLRTRAEENDPAYGAAQQRFDTLLAIEAVAMVAVLVLAAVLGHTAPGGG
ncbi:CopD family protein [Paraburkholderia pallida]|uniref:Copper resistance protein CopD n=1 Tax=Paraburkholderia pallida TaxID=2547399 RepID=A0A4P7D697_9BURK|nr:CopD family protein [Paraburkholderia pallida]QBR02174.1 copper resistance protein CopD [Paraburkholderia pallida]